jgi:hypothetical protein
MNMKDPIVVDPPGFDIDAAWQECKDYVDRCGGLSHPDGEPNMRAAFGADPGCCSCPACQEYHWAFGCVQKCTKCGFEYPTDWWPMYSYGAQAFFCESKYKHEERLSHPYYRYGFEHPVDRPQDEMHKIDWKNAFEHGEES